MTVAILCVLCVCFGTPTESWASGGGGGAEIILITLAPFTTTAELGITLYHSVGWAISTTSSPAVGMANVQRQYLKNNQAALQDAFVLGGGVILNDLAVIYHLPSNKHQAFIRSIRQHRRALVVMMGKDQKEMKQTHRFLFQLARQFSIQSKGEVGR